MASARSHPPDAIERQLAHGEPNAVRDAYNSAKHLQLKGQCRGATCRCLVRFLYMQTIMAGRWTRSLKIATKTTSRMAKAFSICESAGRLRKNKCGWTGEPAEIPCRVFSVKQSSCVTLDIWN